MRLSPDQIILWQYGFLKLNGTIAFTWGLMAVLAFGSMLVMTPYNDVRFGLLGGSIVDANALLRSYILHCIGIPIVASILMIVHFWRVRKDGGISGPAPVMLEAEADKPRRGPKAAGE